MISEVFAAENNKPLSLYDYNLFLSAADKKKQETILKYKNRSNADNSLIGIALAKSALTKVFGLHGNELEFGFGTGGKPFLINRPDIFFNISHSHSLVVCAVADTPIGIDVEKIRSYNKRLADKVFGKEIALKLCNSPDCDAEFTKLWTEKEAVLKLTGEGISGIRNQLSTDAYKLETVLYKDYYITTAIYK